MKGIQQGTQAEGIKRKFEAETSPSAISRKLPANEPGKSSALFFFPRVSLIHLRRLS
jgi:hypothetical protein